MTICSGCHRSFPRGYLSHIRQSHNPACRALAVELDAHVPSTAMPTDEPEPEPEPPVIDADGDYYGDYANIPPIEWGMSVDEESERAASPPDMLGPDDVSERASSPLDMLGPDDSDSDSESELDMLDEAAAAAECEKGWEPAAATQNSRARSPSPEVVLPDDDDDAPSLPSNARLQLPRHPYVRKYPNVRAGEPIGTTQTENDRYRGEVGEESVSNVWAPFTSEIDWKVARWAKLRGSSSTALTELLAIPGLQERLDLSFKTANDLNKIIDKHMPGRPTFTSQEVVIQGEAFEVYFRNVLECVKALYSDPEFTPYLKFAAEQHFADEDGTVRMYHDMHTGKWWWATQETLDKHAGPGGTIIPIIISTDKTQVTVFRNKSAYPVYLTIGNIPKEIRRKPSFRAYILIGYLPTSRLEHITNKASRRRCLANLFHTCMTHILAPLNEPASEGVVMTSGDGVRRRGHPIFAAYVCDYPEQILVTCCTSGDCPQCEAENEELDDEETYPMRNLRKILDALSMVAEEGSEGAAAFIKACREAGIKPIFEPFWLNLSYSNVFLSITPDLLHQLYQGVFKHLKNWVIEAYGSTEIDARCRRLPPNHNIRVFMKGISTLSRVTGQEHNQMSRFLLGLILEAPLSDGMSSVRLVRALRALVDFLFLAQYPVHTDKTIAALEDALKRFHDNKQIFVDLDIRNGFKIPKLHFLDHYANSITMLGTLDNFNTEYTERLHIDLAKDAYRATNHKDEYPQMTQWLERKEKVMRHEKFILWRIRGSQNILRVNWIPPALLNVRTLKMTKHPSVRRVPIESLKQLYGATFFAAALARFIAQFRNPTLSGRRLEDAAASVYLPVATVSTFHRIKFIEKDVLSGALVTADSIHSQPSRITKRNKDVPGRFDTALIRVRDETNDEIRANRVGQVRVVFTLSSSLMEILFHGVPDDERPRHLAYIDWFSTFGPRPEPNHDLFKVSRCTVEGGNLASVVDVTRIKRSVHLLPKFGRSVNRDWTSSNVLDRCSTFFVNSFSDRNMYQLFI